MARQPWRVAKARDPWLLLRNASHAVAAVARRAFTRSYAAAEHSPQVAFPLRALLMQQTMHRPASRARSRCARFALTIALTLTRERPT